MILRIFDSRNRVLVSLLKLCEALLSQSPQIKDRKWAVQRVIANHGIHACNLEEVFYSAVKVEICFDELTKWLKQGEVFTSLRLHSAVVKITIGIEDSTYLFVESQNCDLINAIKSCFESVQIVE